MAAVAGVVHFIWRVKADLREPLIYAGVLLLLLAIRLIPWCAQQRRGRRVRRPSASR